MNSTDINSTFMASYMKVDSGTFPPQMKLKNASLLSSLFKSPGMGFVIVEMEDYMFITLTFCEDEIPVQSIDTLTENLSVELNKC